MPQTPEEIKSGLIKIGIYVFGVILGLAVKLSKIARYKKLRVVDFVMHSLLAFSAAFLIWHVLDYYNKRDMANVISVIVGRFGDDLILLIYEKIKNFLKTKEL